MIVAVDACFMAGVSYRTKNGTCSAGDVWTGLPEFGHSFGVGILLELIGAACVVWAWRAFDFTDPVKRSRFIRTGHLTRVVESPPTC